MAEDSAKHGGSNGKKEGLSGSSFFTWFMVIALLGVWTSVAVVWFDLVDYEDVLGKLDAYDTDGDGDFDIEDAKILLGLSSLPVEKAAKAPDVSRGSLKTKTKEEVKEGIKEQLKRVKEKYLAPLKEKSHRDGEKPKKDSGRGDKDEEKSAHRRKKDDKEITKRTTSGRISNADRDRKTEKKADKQ